MQQQELGSLGGGTQVGGVHPWSPYDIKGDPKRGSCPRTLKAYYSSLRSSN
jgi:hypothetical protein